MSSNVYLVDDDEAVRKALTLLLETVGLNVISFASPEIFHPLTKAARPTH